MGGGDGADKLRHREPLPLKPDFIGVLGKGAHREEDSVLHRIAHSSFGDSELEMDLTPPPHTHINIWSWGCSSCMHKTLGSIHTQM